MNNELSKENADLSRPEVVSALFANMVIQHTNMAFMFLGRVPHPETGEVMTDLNTAKFFIDQLEMLEVKTKGNLDKREDGLLKQSLTSLRLAFVEVAAQPQTEAKSPSPKGPDVEQPKTSTAASEAAPSVDEDEESRKRFSKKY